MLLLLLIVYSKTENIEGVTEDIDKLKAEYTMLNDTNFWKDKLTAKYGKNNAVPIMQELDKLEARYHELKGIFEKPAKGERTTKLHEGVAKVIEHSDLWKYKKAGLLYSRETMERNFRDIIPDRKEAEKVIDYFFSPVHENTARATNLKNYYRELIKALHISQKNDIPIQIGGQNIKVSESFLVQHLGEGEFQLKKLMKKSN